MNALQAWWRNRLHFSFTTLTCAGYGDIQPSPPVATGLATFEAICGQLYPATLLARVVPLHGGGR